MKTNLLCNLCAKPLTGKQARWCSRAHRVEGYNVNHRVEKAASVARSRARKASIAAGLPQPLTHAEALEAIAQLEVELIRLRLITEGPTE